MGSTGSSWASGTGWVMRRLPSEPSYGLRVFVLGAAAVGTAITFSTTPVDARYHRYQARYVHRAVAVQHATHGYQHAHAETYSPPSSSIVVDGNSGAVLHAANADAARHPASLTKIMTLYLLFERLEAGKVKLDTPLKISAHAAEQAPTKLGVKPGQTLAVEDAIKAVVTKSANDAAVAIAENLGGDEDEFAKMMTAKAHALGMSRTTYVNASGLPNDDQITTAHDQALLGRAIQERFPRYYKYFSTEQFTYHGHAMRNHNHLLGVVGGVDGIKTGYTHASGFNLVTSVHRDGRYIIAVVLGGRSSGERDAHMRELINAHIREASLQRTAPAIAERAAPAIAERAETRPEPRNPSSERSEQRAEPKPVVVAKTSPSSRSDQLSSGRIGNGAPATGGDPIQPLLVKTITYRTAPVQASALGPMPQLVPAAAPLPRSAAMALPTLPAAPATTTPAGAQPAPQIVSAPAPSPAAAARPTPAAALLPAPAQTPAVTSVARTTLASTGETTNTVVVAATESAVTTPASRIPTPGRSVIAKSDRTTSDGVKSDSVWSDSVKSEVVRLEPPPPEAASAEAAKAEVMKPDGIKSEPAKTDIMRPEVAKLEAAKSTPAKVEPAKIDITKPEPSAAQIRARGGWVIQIGAFEAEDEAKQHLSEARLKIPRILASADPFTERVQKGDKALYRARFAGFDKAMAEAACKELKRSDIACMTVKN
jgi:D-alanyl-D-alanine carboxypeptidase